MHHSNASDSTPSRLSAFEKLAVMRLGNAALARCIGLCNVLGHAQTQAASPEAVMDA